MDEFYESVLPFFLGLLTVVIGVIYWKCLRSSEKKEQIETISDEVNNQDSSEEPVAKNTTKLKKLLQSKKKEVKDTYSHPWLVTNLKGHTAELLDIDFSSNGKLLASCGIERAVILWTVKTFAEKNHRSVRVNIEFDHGTRIKWSPDSKAFIISAASANTIQIYKIGKKSDGALGNAEMILKFPEAHKSDIINIGIACNGHFMMSCSSDTNLTIWDLKGEILTTLDTLHINNYYACVSPCGRFVASSGFTPDVRIWEVCFTKTGQFKEVKRAFELKGHTSGVCHFSFSNDSSKMATVSKDGTWKLWNTNIEYDKGQEPYLLKSCHHGIESKSSYIIALSPDGRTVALASTSTPDLYIYSGITGDLQVKLDNIHSEPVKAVQFSPGFGHYIAVAVGRHIRIFHNVPGYKNIILDLEESKMAAKQASLKDRLQVQIDEARLALKNFEEC